MKELDARSALERYIENRLAEQYKWNSSLTPYDHVELLKLVDAGVLGTVAFKYFVREDSHR